MTKSEFLQLTIKQVSQVYFGKRNCCRCGCGGEYTATSYMLNPSSDVNDELVAQRLKRAQSLVEKGAEFDNNDNDPSCTYFDVKTGAGRTLTFYFDELK